MGRPAGSIMSNNDYIDKCFATHGDLYILDNVVYTGSNNYISVVCRKHGVFEIKAKNFLCGSGCSKCGHEKPREKHWKIDREQFFNRIHGKFECFDFSESVYIDVNSNMEVFCKKHGLFTTTGRKLLSSHSGGCKKCRSEQARQFRNGVVRSDVLHSNWLLLLKNKFPEYEFGKTIIKSAKDKIIVTCKKHEDFLSCPDKMLNSNYGCPICRSSKGERVIRNFLIANNIRFERQFGFRECRDKSMLPFDFYLLDYDKCIEYDGELHYKPWKRGTDSIQKLQLTQKHDSIKTEFCNKNNIPLLRIPYWEYKNIDKLLKDFVLC